jgi:hypothetical protein
MATGFRWIKPPEEIQKALAAYEKKALAAAHAVAAYVGQAMQDDARQNAPWEDRTGNARGGLFFAIDGFGLPPVMGRVSVSGEAAQGEGTFDESGGPSRLILTLGHTMYYGKYLETAHGAKYAIVMSTIEGHLPQLEAMLQGLFAGGVSARADTMVTAV